MILLSSSTVTLIFLFSIFPSNGAVAVIPKANTETKTISRTNSFWTDCSSSSDPMTINSISISPMPLSRGARAYVVMTAELDEDVKGGKILVVLKYSGFTFLRKKYNLCNFASDYLELMCPLQNGFVTLTYEMLIDSSLPSGQYTGSIIAFNRDNQELACVSLNLNIGA